jgi:hypothetical protein
VKFCEKEGFVPFKGLRLPSKAGVWKSLFSKLCQICNLVFVFIFKFI